MSGNSPAKPVNDSARPVDWLLYNADWLLTCDPLMHRHSPGAIAIEASRIAAAGPSEEIRRAFRGRREADLSGCLLMPGLVNTHTHAAMTLFRGIADDIPLKQWLEGVIFPLEGHFVNPRNVYTGTLLATVEMLLGGTTTFCDGYFFEHEAARAAMDSGMRAVMGQGILDFPTPDQPDPARYLRKCETFLSDFPGDGKRVRPSLFCHAPYTCSPETLRTVKAVCRKHGILFQTHLAETAGEVDGIVGMYGRRPGEHLSGLGILDSLTLCAHSIWLTNEEILAIARSDASISHCPESAMKLASGVAAISDFLSHGARVGLGTDGSASNNDLDMFSEMDTCAKLHKVVNNDPTACPAETVLKMATLGGACAIGLGEETGSLEAGKKADIVLIDLNRAHITPLYDPVSHIVYSALRSDVKAVWVDGRQVVAHGKVLTVDQKDVLAEANRIGAIIARREF
ncbi:MAG: amidohydrolase [Desulfobacteraceae bacterium]|nr:amidohydrolase [Desulfobacteraceae bacterium]